MTLQVTLVDCGVGNLHSLTKALERAGAQVAVSREPGQIERAQALVFPGVGAFGDAMETLHPVRDLLKRRLEAGVPALGVCLGMQVLFERSEESPGARGLGFIRGTVKRLPSPKLPQVGWNVVNHVEGVPLFRGIPDGRHVYYVNSFAPVPEEPVTVATSTYGATFTAAVRKRNAYGVQFHPEKSSTTGLQMIANFVHTAKEATA
ncbi:MAG TPA: imidazole glycerol phosphate synthase subunit HisH [Candidatus Thermoplasmatota archaeon]|nr:imidazole glycerol phosphate synthase subunit HisH [Candidatus Thermoplasmatota archaeon]